jgi:heme exporter protein D
MFLLVVVLPVHVSFGLCIAYPFFFWSSYCLSMLPLVVVLPPKEAWTDNTTTKRNMDRQYNDQKKHRQTIQLPKET